MPHFSSMLNLISLLRRRLRRPSKPRITVSRRNPDSAATSPAASPPHYGNGSSAAAVHPKPHRPIRLATFNAALFSMAPAVRTPTRDPEDAEFTGLPLRSKSTLDRPKSILKQSPLHPTSDHNLSARRERFARSRLRVSINLPDNEISRQLSFRGDDRDAAGRTMNSQVRSTVSFSGEREGSSRRTVLEVLREVEADVLALQDVKADEADEMRPLSDLAAALEIIKLVGWFGSSVHKIFDDSDFRNVLKATIDVPVTGEVEFHCTHLDHLDENWRMKQIDAIIRSSNGVPHILAGALNSLDETDYSPERWTDIVKYYEEMGKPVPRAEVMRFLKSKEYTDAKDYAGECESVVVVAKGQSVQGTCKYGTRVDYIMASPESPYEFVPGSYSVLSSKGTSDHHVVKVDLLKSVRNVEHTDGNVRQRNHGQQRVVKIKADDSSPAKGIWRT
ncbi:PREDICTED: uncharacterized protein LOC104817622 [Tarenaya hassleriana]|uniref:uncharacterized protein LOC104817622 n=1 Tax=Tarenaya hassleriana TaxID=28532 RepID=UPI0008FD849A|nr:PREDICTED: uncharacterized protein LOC104817622 [Tarenaya hassleriana]